MTHTPEKYAAFISYRHVESDRAWAIRLHTLLETFRTPKALVDLGFPSKLGRIFRDEEELAVSSDLSASITAALDQSAWLIVVCSPETPKSEWVNAELARFREMGRHDRILALLIAGEPRESFPKLLCEMRRKIAPAVASEETVEQVELIEPLAADVRLRAGTSAAELRSIVQLRFAAAILGVQFDDLRQRDLQRRLQAARQLLGVVTGVALLIICLAYVAWQQREVAVGEHAKAEHLATKNLGLANEANLKRVEAEKATANANRRLAANYFQNGLFEYESDRFSQSYSHLIRAVLFAPPDDPRLPSYRRIALDRLVRGGRLLTPPLVHPEKIKFAKFSKDGTRVLTMTGTRDASAYLWDSSNGSKVGETGQLGAGVKWCEFSHDGSRVLVEHEDYAQLWDSGSGHSIGGKLSRSKYALSEFSADSSRLLIVNKIEEKFTFATKSSLWDSTNGELIRELSLGRSNNCCKFTPDAKFLIAISSSGKIELWDASNGLSYGKPIETRQDANDFHVSPDGKRLITESVDFGSEGLAVHTTALWDLISGKAIGEPIEHKRAITEVIFSPDSSRYITIYLNEKSARMWNTDSGEEVVSELLNDRDITWAKFSPDSSRLLTTGLGSKASLWSSRTAKRIKILAHKEYGIRGEFGPDGCSVLTFGDTETRYWNAADGNEIYGSPLKHVHSVHRASYSPSGNRILTVTADKQMRIWETRFGSELGEPIRHEGEVVSAEFCPDGIRLLTASANTAFLWVLPVERNSISSGVSNPTFALSPSGSEMVIANFRTIQLWDVTSQSQIGVPLELKESVESLRLQPNGKRLLIAASDKTTRQLNINGWLEVGERLIHRSNKIPAQYSPDGAYILTAVGENTLQLWESQAGSIVGRPMQHNSLVTSAIFSPDGTRILTTSKDKTARQWHSATGNPIGEPLSHKSELVMGCYSPDGSSVLTVCSDGSGLIWDLQTGNMQGRRIQHDDHIALAIFSPSGDIVLTASWDKTAQTFDVNRDLAVIHTLRHEDGVCSAEFSPDQNLLITGSRDGTVQIWDAATGSKLGIDLRSELGSNTIARFTSDGMRIVTVDDSQFGRFSFAELPFHLQAKPPLDDALTLAAEVWTNTDLDSDVSRTSKPEDAVRRRVRLHFHPFWRSYFESHGAQLNELHMREANVAGKWNDWFAAAWHAERFVQKNPGNTTFNERCEIAKRNWAIQKSQWEQIVSDEDAGKARTMVE